MHAKRILFGLMVCAVWTANAAVAQPAPREVRYTVHVDQNDFDSDTLISMTLRLTPVSFSNDWIGWRVDEALIESPEPNARTWSQSTPILDSSDGLWWIQHADPTTPEDAEFSCPPAIEGVAGPLEGTTSELEYSYECAAASPEQTPPGNSAPAFYMFHPVATTQPVATSDETERIVEIDVRHSH